MYNKLELKSVIARYGDRQSDLAEAIGITQSMLSNRINGNSEFSRPEIEAIASRYNLTADEIQKIFFTFEVS